MTKMPNRLNIPIAAQNRSNFPLNSVHETTADFGTTQVSYFIPMVPDDKIHLKMDSFARLTPMLAPTMGSCSVVHRAFFVPNDFICADWKGFIDGKALNDGSTSAVPTIPEFTYQDLYDLFFIRPADSVISGSDPSINTWWTAKMSNPSSYVIASGSDIDLFSTLYYTNSSNPTPPSTGSWDYKLQYYHSGSSSTYDVFVRLSPLGKIVLNLLIQLGYNVPFDLIFNIMSSSDRATTTKSMLPIYALTKCYVDYFVDPRYNWNDFTTIFRTYTSDYWNGVGGAVPLMHDMLVLCAYAWFDNDLFTSSWASPDAATPFGHFKTLSVSTEYYTDGQEVNAYEQKSSGSTQVKDVRATFPTGSNVGAISQRLITLLEKVASMVKRSQVAGARPIDQAAARYGVKIPEIAAERATYLGSARVPLRVSSIDATANGTTTDGSSSVLGDYTGKGIMSGQNFSVNYENPYFYGFLIIISHIVPDARYFEGDKPWVNMIDRFDFHLPEMEDTGTQPIPLNEVWNNGMQYTPANYGPNSIFGYAPRYYAYKFGFDTLSGDFRNRNYLESLRPYHFFRELIDPTDELPTTDPLQNNAKFRRWDDSKRESYERIFLSQDIREDHFILDYFFEVSINRPMMSIGRSLISDIEEGRKTISVKPNGNYN